MFEDLSLGAEAHFDTGQEVPVVESFRPQLRKRRQFIVAVLVAVLLLLLGCSAKNSEMESQINDKSQNKTIPKTRIEGPIVYLALGDSTGAGVGSRNGGYPARIFQRILTKQPGSRLINLCVSGATTADVLRNQLDRGLVSQPNLITLGIGINDIGHGLDVEEFGKNYERIVSSLRSKSQAHLVIINIPEISSAPRIPDFARAEYQRVIVNFNRRLEEIASRYDVTVFDVHTTTREQLPAHPEFFSSDGFHPSDAGYELWANEMWPVISRTIGVD